MTRMNKFLIAACAVVGVAAFSQAHALSGLFRNRLNLCIAHR